MDTATLLLLSCGIGLILALVWTVYRINSHKRKISRMEGIAGEVERDISSRSERKVSPPSGLPESELLIVLYRNRDRPWRGTINSRTSLEGPLVVVTTDPPDQIRTIYKGLKSIVWLDRSTAHDLEEDEIVVNPTNLSRVLDEINNTIGKKGGIVVFEGFEGILAANEMSRVIRFLTMLRRSCNDRSISAVVPLPYKAVTQRVRNQLVEGFESVVVG